MVEDFIKYKKMDPATLNRYVNMIIGEAKDVAKKSPQIMKAKSNLDKAIGKVNTIEQALEREGLNAAKGLTRGSDLTRKYVKYIKPMVNKYGSAVKGAGAIQGIGNVALSSSPRNKAVGALQTLGTGLTFVPHPVAKGVGYGLDIIAPFLYDYNYNKGSRQTNSITNEQAKAIDNLYNENNSNIQPQLEPITSDIPELDAIGRMLQSGQIGSGNQIQEINSMQELPQLQQENIMHQELPQSTNFNSDINDVIQMYIAKQQANLPYQRALQQYINDYPELVNKARRLNKYYTGAAGFTGNNIYTRLADKYSPESVEANKLALIKELAQTQMGNISPVLEARGNVAVAQQLGLPAEAAMADKNLLNAYTAQQKAQLGLEGSKYKADQSFESKKYVADQALRGKLETAYLDSATKKALAEGNWKLAQQLQQTKNINNLQRAYTNIMSFGGTQEDIQLLNNMMGSPVQMQNIQQGSAGNFYEQ